MAFTVVRSKPSRPKSSNADRRMRSRVWRLPRASGSRELTLTLFALGGRRERENDNPAKSQVEKRLPNHRPELGTVRQERVPHQATEAEIHGFGNSRPLFGPVDAPE